jgi:hypothetical protein
MTGPAARARFASTSREYRARNLGAMTQQTIGVNTTLKIMTIGMRILACCAKLARESTVIAPIPKRTEDT